MRTIKVVAVLAVLCCFFLALSAPVLAQITGSEQNKGMWCNMSNADLGKICKDEAIMKGLTAEQRKEIDKEWQRRIPDMTPEDIKLYYPEGTRYQGQ